MSAILDERNQIDNSSKKKLRGRLTSGTVALLIALLAVISATYAWYVYNTGRHTTKVRMAAGAGVNLQISNSYNGTYGSAAVLESFSGQLNPVSTNRISGGFQKVLGFTNGTENQSNLVASLFGSGDYSDYYKTSLFLRTNGNPTDIYISDIGFEDSDESKPISSAIRAGFVVHSVGQNQPTVAEYIFAISDKKIRRRITTQPPGRKAMYWTVRRQMERLWPLHHILQKHMVHITRIQEKSL